MLQEKTKVYIYTRVSTAMQIDGYSLDAQKARMKAYADFNDYQIVGEYEDAGKSGKSIEGRASFCRMMEDIKSGKDGVAYVLVFKLSRFGRNAADVLSTLQVMQDFGVNLICVEDGIDSSKDAGKLMISLSVKLLLLLLVYVFYLGALYVEAHLQRVHLDLREVERAQLVFGGREVGSLLFHRVFQLPVGGFHGLQRAVGQRKVVLCLLERYVLV